MKIASWNVNSIKARLGHVLDWIERSGVDVLCLQEIKTIEESFPKTEFEQRGYHLAISGQPTYNGVAIISRAPLSGVGIGFVEDTESAQRRLLEARVDGVRIVNVYVPNGQDVSSPKFAFKLDWLARLRAWLDATARPDEPLVLCGDFNVAPEERDVWSVEALTGQVLFTEDERAALRHVADFGLLDSFRLFEQAPGHFSWWDYRMMAFRLKRGLRIDHLWITRPLAERCRAGWIDVAPRRLEKASDHTPVGLDLY